MQNLWSAPTSPGPLDATVDLPGSKSLTNRHLVLAALGAGTTRLVAPLDSRDTRLMADALRVLGARVDTDGVGEDGTPFWSVTPLDLEAAQAQTSSEPLQIDCGLAGTVMRFVPAVAALLRRPVRFDGDDAARVRPMGPVIQALKDLGAVVEGGEDGFLPFTVTGTDAVRGGEIAVDASGSSQFVSALLLAAARLPQGLTVRHEGRSLPSPQHIEMTLTVLRQAGVPASSQGTSFTVGAAIPAPGDVVVEPDLSNAGPFLGAALVCGGEVRVPRWPAQTTQIGDLWREILPAMGAEVSLGEDGVLSVRGTGALRGVTAADTGELAPTLTALCALAEGPSTLTGIAHLRGHETDRLAALVTELARVGVPAHELSDGLSIEPVAGAAHGAVWESYEDHRMATAGALVGLAVPGVSVVDIATTGKTLPDFVGMWERMLASAVPATEEINA